jgi:endonuclease/exonuclease/phosphatase family metal-dependent hydrolase
MAKAISACDADIVGLNEMRGLGTHKDYEAQVERLADLTGMKYFYFSKAIDFAGYGPYGNGILSKYPILSAETVLVPDPEVRAYNGYYETRAVLKAELEGGITVLVTHMGLNPDEQNNAVETILQHLTDEKCILMGDFNVTPDSKILEPLYQRMNDTAVYFTEPKLSFPSDKPAKKIDYIFTSPDLEVTAADIPDLVVSDHRPYFIDINL